MKLIDDSVIVVDIAQYYDGDLWQGRVSTLSDSCGETCEIKVAKGDKVLFLKSALRVISKTGLGQPASGILHTVCIEALL